MLDAETVRIFDERYESVLHERRIGFPQEVQRLQGQLAARGISNSGIAINDLTELYRKEVKGRSESAFDVLKEVVADLESTSPTLADDMKPVLKAKIEGQLAELHPQYLGAAGGATLATSWPLRLKSEADNAIRTLSARVDQFAAVMRRIERAEPLPSATGGGQSGNIDGLTNLMRREALDATLPVQFAAAQSAGFPLSLIMVDIDHFKLVNDAHGHPKGDDVLRDVAECVRSTVEGKGLAFRYGGEEIMVVLPNHDQHEATAVAERLRMLLESRRPGDLEVTASLGVATYPTHAQTEKELVAHADAALYDAKERGRNLVRVHGDSVESVTPSSGPRRKQPGVGVLTPAEQHAIQAQIKLVDAARAFRDERIERLRAGVGLRGISDGGAIVLHVLPINGRGDRVDLPSVKPRWGTDLYLGGADPIAARPNADGWLCSSAGGGRHVQVFRDGGGWEVRLDLAPFAVGAMPPPHQTLDGNRLEAMLAKWAKMGFLWLSAADIKPPYAVLLSLLDVEHTRFGNYNNPSTSLLYADHAIDVPHVLLREQILDQIPDDSAVALAAIFDAMWQAASWPRSAARDDNGKVVYEAAIVATKWP